MCNFKVLIQNADGYVVSCQSCKSIQFAFGTALAKVSPDYFQELTELIRLENVCRPQGGSDNVKSIVIPLEDGFMLCLTLGELRKLELMLHEAAAMYETYRILEYI